MSSFIGFTSHFVCEVIIDIEHYILKNCNVRAGGGGGGRGRSKENVYPSCEQFPFNMPFVLFNNTLHLTRHLKTAKHTEKKTHLRKSVCEATVFPPA